MEPFPLPLGIGIVDRVLEVFVADVTAAAPRILAGLLFLGVAAIGIRAAMVVVRWSLRRAFPGESPVYRQFVASVALLLLGIVTLLSVLSIVGLTAIAAALGTATGFLALGVSYALSGMIEDAVAGVYLLRDPDFMPGDTVVVGDTTGVIASIELRKTRLAVEDDTLVRANAGIEKQWTKAGASEA